MTGALQEAARSVARRFAVVGEAAFAEDGRTTTAASAGAALTVLERRIYLRCHLHATELPDGDAAVDERLRRALRARIGARISVEDGWELIEPSRVRKDGVTLSVTPRELCAASGAAPGDMVGVRFPAARPRALPGWFLYVSRHGQPDGGRGLWRVYANVRARHAASALARMSCWLEAARARFQLKVLDWSRIGGRPDALVAFTGAADVDAAIRCAVRMGSEGWLEAATPGFATRVAPGVAIAPEPASAGHAGRSYGQACARSAAEASVDAWRLGVDCEERRAAIIAERLERDLAPAPPIPLEERA